MPSLALNNSVEALHLQSQVICKTEVTLINVPPAIIDINFIKEKVIRRHKSFKMNKITICLSHGFFKGIIFPPNLKLRKLDAGMGFKEIKQWRKKTCCFLGYTDINTTGYLYLKGIFQGSQDKLGELLPVSIICENCFISIVTYNGQIDMPPPHQGKIPHI